MKLGVVMDPIGQIKAAKDSSLALLLAAQDRGWELLYMEPGDLCLRDGRLWSQMRPLEVRDDVRSWYRLGEMLEAESDQLDVILLRVDPPITMEYIYLTHLLEFAEAAGSLVVNAPAGVRGANEKIFAGRFADFMPPTLVSSDPRRLHAFLRAQGSIVLKPLNAMGGRSVIKVSLSDLNAAVLIDLMTSGGTVYTMAQGYLRQVLEGDKRIFLIDGEPLPYGLLRQPPEGDFRANMVVGGSYRGEELSGSDYRLCEQLRPVLREQGLLFVGLDVIGGLLTEVNVTSPTGIRELDKLYALGIADQILDCIEAKLRS